MTLMDGERASWTGRDTVMVGAVRALRYLIMSLTTSCASEKRFHQPDGSMLRSSYLVHWTGIELTTASDFVCRLVSFYDNGLYLSPPKYPDTIRGVGNQELLLPVIPMICFTEIHIHETMQHTREYGTLGIGFKRNFLLELGASPVFYVLSASKGIVNTNITQIRSLVCPAYYPALDVILAYFKPMNKPDESALEHYEEHEWRIVEAGDGIPLPEQFQWVYLANGQRRRTLRFKPEDVAVIIFPDAETRATALSDPKLADRFSIQTPMMLDYEACLEM